MNRLNPFPSSLACKHLQSSDILFKQQGHRALIRVSGNDVRFNCVMVFSRASRVPHPAKPILGAFIIRISGYKIIFGEFEDNSDEDIERYCNTLKQLSLKWCNLIPV